MNDEHDDPPCLDFDSHNPPPSNNLLTALKAEILTAEGLTRIEGLSWVLLKDSWTPSPLDTKYFNVSRMIDFPNGRSLIFRGGGGGDWSMLTIQYWTQLLESDITYLGPVCNTTCQQTRSGGASFAKTIVIEAYVFWYILDSSPYFPCCARLL